MSGFRSLEFINSFIYMAFFILLRFKFRCHFSPVAAKWFGHICWLGANSMAVLRVFIDSLENPNVVVNSLQHEE
jgi:hypothetical protein